MRVAITLQLNRPDVFDRQYCDEDTKYKQTDLLPVLIWFLTE